MAYGIAASCWWGDVPPEAVKEFLSRFGLHAFDVAEVEGGLSPSNEAGLDSLVEKIRERAAEFCEVDIFIGALDNGPEQELSMALRDVVRAVIERLRKEGWDFRVFGTLYWKGLDQKWRASFLYDSRNDSRRP